MSEDSPELPPTPTIETKSAGCARMNLNADKASAIPVANATSKPTSSTVSSQSQTTSTRTNSEAPTKTSLNQPKTTISLKKTVPEKNSNKKTKSKSTPANTVITGISSKKIVLKSKRSRSSEGKPVSKTQFNDVVKELKELKSKLFKIELEVAALHEIVREQDDLTAEALAILPDDFNFEDTVDEEKTRWSKRVLPQNDPNKNKTVPSTVPMMCNSHAWFGDTFLFEVMCQYKGYRPKQNNWFNSIYPFSTFDHFTKQIFARKTFFHSCVIAIGYSDLFNARPITGQRMKRSLHLLLNHMQEHGAKRIKVLSIPPARQTMKNEEYLQICQTTNRFLKYVTQTHAAVDFINMDSLFINNYNDSFKYFSGETVAVQISNYLLMRKEGNKFAIYVEPETATRLVDYVSNYETGSEKSSVNQKRGSVDRVSDYESKRYDDRKPIKRRMDSSYGSEYPSTKRSAVSFSEDSYEYLPSQSTHSKRQESSRTNSSGHRSPISRQRSPFESGRHRSPLRSPIRDDDRGDRYKSPERDSPYYRSARDSKSSYDGLNNKPRGASITRTIRNDLREQNSRHDRYQYSSSYNSDHDRSRHSRDPKDSRDSRNAPHYPDLPTRNYDDLRNHINRSPMEKRSVNVRKSASPPPWLKKTHSSSSMG